ATMAYQGYGLGVDLETIRDLNALATGGLTPDLTLLLDLDPAVGMARIRDRRLDAFEKMDLTFHRRVRDGYLGLPRTESRRAVALGASQPPDAIFASIEAIGSDRVLNREGLRAP